MGMLIKESTYGAVNANDQRTDGFYIVHFLSTVYTLQHDELVDNEILKAGSLVVDAEYMSPAMKESLWYVKSGLEPVKVNMNKVLVSNIDVDIVTSTSELDYSISTMTQEDVIQKEPFKLNVNDYDNILDEVSKGETIGFELGGSDEIDTI
jgi:hypothetical protein